MHNQNSKIACFYISQSGQNPILISQSMPIVAGLQDFHWHTGPRWLHGLVVVWCTTLEWSIDTQDLNNYTHLYDGSEGSEVNWEQCNNSLSKYESGTHKCLLQTCLLGKLRIFKACHDTKGIIVQPPLCQHFSWWSTVFLVCDHFTLC